VTDRTRVVLGRTILVVEAILVVGLLALLVAVQPTYRQSQVLQPTDRFFAFLIPLMGLAYVAIGTLIVIRRGNVLGWLLCGIGLGFTLAQYSDTYTLYALVTSPGSPPGARYVALSAVFFGLAGSLIGPLFLLFPDGRVPGPRWRPLLVIGPAATLAATLVFALREGPLNGTFNDFGIRIENPIGFLGRGPVSVITGVLGLVALAAGLACAVSLVIRYRRSAGDERQQIRWLAYVGAAALFFFLGLFVTGAIFGEGFANDLAWFAFFLTLSLGVPVACAIAIFRYRLYDLDLVLKKTVVFATVVVAMTVLYTVVAAFLVPVAVLGIGVETRGALVTIALGVLIGILVIPARNRARRFADRVVYGKRATPYEVLAEFSGRLAETYSIDDVLPRMVQLLIAGTGAVEVRVWLRVERELRPVASGPDDVEPAEPRPMTGDELDGFEAGTEVFPIRHQGEPIGAITLVLPANDPMDAEKERLVTDLAGQAGLVLRNVRLIEELRASRQRIVAAQDQERRRIERNIHDGAQQQLVALNVQLRLAEQLVDRDAAAETKAMLGDLQARTVEALEDLRDLARGIYPPLLADRGLAAAVEAQARKAALPTVVRAEGIGRYPQAIESAIYFSVLECLQNVAKYAAADRTEILLAQVNGHLSFVVSDDGRGFDPAASRYGTGLQGIADRMDAIGGRLEIRSSPGAGTDVTGSVPLG
jgi:signal transduction histidine kinase